MLYSLEKRIISDNYKMVNIPNIITILRILFVPFIVILLFHHQYIWAFLMFLLVGLSDALDGYIAKRYDCVTEFGALLDPIADKCLILSSFVMLTYQEVLPFWLAVVVVFRDALIISGVLFVFMLLGKIELKPLWFSKLNTVFQISLIVIALFQLAFFQTKTNVEQSWLYFLVAGTSIFSGIAYIWQGLKLTANREINQKV